MTVVQHSIKDVCIGIYDGPHATPKDSDNGPIFLGIKNVTADGRLDLTEIRHVSEQEFPIWTRRVTPKKDDIVFSYEATLHLYALIPEDFVGCLGRRMALVRPDKTKVVPRFLHYYFLSPPWKAVITQNVITGATVDRIPLARFPEFPVRVPPLAEQQRIADVLSAYDDLIENNRRRIKLLEDAARQLYREWFVHLRFPGHEHVKVVDGVPEGWVVRRLDEICDDARNAVKPENISPGTPYIGLEHMPRRSITLSDWGQSDDVTSQKFAYQVGDILFGKIRPYFHKVGFTLTDGITSSDAIVIRPTDPRLHKFLLLLLSSDQFIALASKTVKEGSKMPRADWKYMQRRTFAVPPDELLGELNGICEPIVGQLKLLAESNAKLRQARNLLLPRLMSGELAV